MKRCVHKWSKLRNPCHATDVRTFRGQMIVLSDIVEEHHRVSGFALKGLSKTSRYDSNLYFQALATEEKCRESCCFCCQFSFVPPSLLNLPMHHYLSKRSRNSQFFPAEQQNNGVYRDGKLLLQSPSVQWLDLIQIKDTDTWLASGIDEEGKYHGHLLLNENDKLAMTNQGYGVYDILKKETGILRNLQDPQIKIRSYQNKV